MADNEEAQMRKQRAKAKAQVIRLINSIKRHLAIPDESVPYQIMEALERDLLNKWQNVQNVHDDYVVALTEPTEEQLETEEGYIEELALKFEEIRLVACQFIIERKEKAIQQT